MKYIFISFFVFFAAISCSNLSQKKQRADTDPNQTSAKISTADTMTSIIKLDTVANMNRVKVSTLETTEELKYLDDSYATRIARLTPPEPRIVGHIIGAQDPHWEVQHWNTPNEDPNHWNGPYDELHYVSPNTTKYKIKLHTDWKDVSNGQYYLTNIFFVNKDMAGGGDENTEVMHILNWERKHCLVSLTNKGFGIRPKFQVTVLDK
jgi:hypothetical protein